MSVIDKKGKLFGKLNIIDLIAIIIIIVVVVLLAFKFLGNRNSTAASSGQQVVYTVKVENVDPQVYQSIQNQLPSQLMASGDMLNGYVTKVEATPSKGNTIQLDTNNDYGSATVSKVDDGNYDLVFTIEATFTNATTHTLGTQEIRIGKSTIVKTQSFELSNGIILSCQDKAAQQ